MSKYNVGVYIIEAVKLPENILFRGKIKHIWDPGVLFSLWVDRKPDSMGLVRVYNVTIIKYKF